MGAESGERLPPKQRRNLTRRTRLSDCAAFAFLPISGNLIRFVTVSISTISRIFLLLLMGVLPAVAGRSVPLLKEALCAAGRDPEKFPISKRVFMAVDEKPERARAALLRWFTEVYHDPDGTDASGIWGTPEQVLEKLEALVGMGANHLMLNPVFRYAEQLEAVAEVVGLSGL